MKRFLILYIITLLALTGCSQKVQNIPEKVDEVPVFSEKIICIDPGHGITSRREKEPVHPEKYEEKATNVVGASGKLMTEEALNLEIGLKLKSVLEKKGATVWLTRETHECNMSNIERAKFANERNCDMVVRLHADGSENRKVSGVSVLVPSKKSISPEYLTSEIIEKSQRSAELILNEVCQLTNAENRGMVARADLTGFNWSAVPVVLLEMGFISNPEEEQKLANAEYQALIVSGVVSGLEKYFAE